MKTVRVTSSIQQYAPQWDNSTDHSVSTVSRPMHSR